MINEPNSQPVKSPARGLRPVRTLKHAVREIWNNLGLVCALSFTFFIGASIPVYLAFAIARAIAPAPALAALIAGGAYCLLGAQIYGGCCLAAAMIFEHDEVTYADLWNGVRIGYWKYAALAATQVSVALLLFSHLVFYSAMKGIVWLVLAILSVYLMGFWLANCLYHFPLLVAAHRGSIARPGGGPPRVSAVVRNAFVMVLSSPFYSVVLLAVLAPIAILLALSGVGAALLGAGTFALISTRATRDHLIRYGLIPPDQDPDESASDNPWKLRDI